MKKLNRAGEKYINNRGQLLEIIEYIGKDNCSVMFENGCIVKNIKYGNIKRGNVTNPTIPSVFNRGYIGQGIFKSCRNGRETPHYTRWHNIFHRCYSNKNNSYEDVSISKEWHNFQNFAKWYEENWKPWMKGWHLDKDILVKGNKIYSPETCCFVPREINGLFIRTDNKDMTLNVDKNDGKFICYISKKGKTINLGRFNTYEEAFFMYKTEKERYIKEVADEWKDKIELKVYQAMYDYKITRDE